VADLATDQADPGGERTELVAATIIHGACIAAVSASSAASSSPAAAGMASAAFASVTGLAPPPRFRRCLLSA
jgi:hypothetical protein